MKIIKKGTKINIRPLKIDFMDIFYNFLIQIVEYILGMLAISSIIQFAGHAVFGDLTLAVTLTFSLLPITTLGRLLHSMSELPKVLQNKNKQQLSSYVHWELDMVKIVLGVCFLATVIYLGMGYVYSSSFKCLTQACNAHRHVAEDLLLLLPIALLSQWTSNLLAQSQSPILSSLVATKTIVFGLVCAVFNYFDIKFSYHIFLWSLFATFFFMTILQIIITKIYFFNPNELSFRVPASPMDSVRTKKFNQESLALLTAQISYIVTSVITYMMIEYWVKDESMLGIYAVTLRLSALVTMLPFCYLIHLNKLFSVINDTDNLKKFNSDVCRAMLWQVISFVVVLVCVLVGYNSIKTFFTLGDTGFVPLILMICFQSLMSLPAAIVHNVLRLNGYARYSFIGNNIQLVLLIVLGYFMIPNYGIVGAVLATKISLTLPTIGLALIIRKYKLGVKPWGII
ncbi:MAG: hypothetical protein VXY77_03735 [Pseudomonadota bacterium]|nr:hypothetical protein [Pseudomonadota bacterium]